MKFSDKVYYLRKRKGLTQTELATLTNVSQQAIAAWEKGRGIPLTNTMNQLAKVLNVKPEDLTNDERSVV